MYNYVKNLQTEKNIQAKYFKFTFVFNKSNKLIISWTLIIVSLSLLGFLLFSVFFKTIKINNLYQKYDLYNNSNKPKISIFTSIYNKEKYLKRFLESIINQIIKETDIICVIDGSTDNSENIIKKYQKIYNNIKIINNNKNRGQFYSRSIGILNSNGKYLINIDSDDYFEGIDNLEYLYNEAIKDNVDILKFKVFNKNNILFNQCTYFNKIYYQPIIFEEQFDFQYFSLLDFHITDKLVKKEIYMKAFNKIKDKINDNNFYKHEDNIWAVSVRQHAKSMKCVNKLVYIYEKHADSNSLTENSIQDILDLLSRSEYLNYLLDNTKKNYVAFYFSLFLDKLNINFAKEINITKRIIELAENLLKSKQVYYFVKKKLLATIKEIEKHY